MTSQRSNAKRRQPITDHPLFPMLVALWFGALFGLGSMVMRASLIEELVIASRIDLVLPAAAPPLGMTARLLIALAFGAVGTLLGATIGRRLRTRTANPSQPETTDEMIRPDLQDDEGVSEYTAIGRRRTLAKSEPDGAFAVPELAPLPTSAPQFLDIVETGVAPLVEDPLDYEAPDGVNLEDAGNSTAPCAETPDLPTTTTPEVAEQSVAPASPLRGFGVRDPARTAPSATAVPVPAPRPPIDSEIPLTALAERLGEAMRERRGEAPEPASSPEPSTRGPATPATPMALPAAMRLAPAEEPEGDEQDAVLASLRFPRQTMPAPETPQENLDPPTAIVDSNPPGDWDEDDEFFEDGQSEADFGSLLKIAPRPPASLNVESAGEPVVIFPGQVAFQQPEPADGTARPREIPEAIDPDQTARALEQALAGLQRTTRAG